MTATRDIYLGGVGRWLPPAIPLRVARAADLIDSDTADMIGVLGATAATRVTAAQMAARAAIAALAAGKTAPADLSLLLYATFAEEDHLTPAQYVQRVLGAHAARCYEVRAGSAGALSALLTAADHLNLAAEATSALVVAAVRFQAPRWRRWHATAGQIVADGAASVLLSHQRGFARLVATAYASVPEMEQLSREDVRAELLASPQFRRTTFERTGLTPYRELLRDRVTQANREVLAQAGISADQLAHLLVPCLSRVLVPFTFTDPFGLPLERTGWSFSRQTGHVGPCDELLALENLLRQHRLRPGDYVLMSGMGVGLTMCSVLIQILDPPVPRNQIRLDLG